MATTALRAAAAIQKAKDAKDLIAYREAEAEQKAAAEKKGAPKKGQKSKPDVPSDDEEVPLTPAQAKAQAKAAARADALALADTAAAKARIEAESELAEAAFAKMLASKSRPRTKNTVILEAWDEAHSAPARGVDLQGLDLENRSMKRPAQNSDDEEESSASSGKRYTVFFARETGGATAKGGASTKWEQKKWDRSRALIQLRVKKDIALTNKDADLLYAGNFKFVPFANLAAAPLNFDTGEGAIISTKLIAGQTAYAGVISDRFSFIACLDNWVFTTEYFFGPGFHLTLTLQRLREAMQHKMRIFSEVTHVHALAWWSHVMSHHLANLENSVRPEEQESALVYPHHAVAMLIQSMPASSAASPKTAPAGAHGSATQPASHKPNTHTGAAAAPRVASAGGAGATKYKPPNNFPDACRDWNSKSCKRHNCRFRHVCMSCELTTHVGGALVCTRR
jgi:hypothetical protein